MHARSSLFSLVGRRVVITKTPQQYERQAVIVGKIPGKMRFVLHIDGCVGNFYYDRCEFKLPPLPRHTRDPVWLPDDYNGFVYAGVEGF